MPIKPENKGLYPKDWAAIRAQVLVRAQGRCEWEGCGLENYARGARDTEGNWYTEREIENMALSVYDKLFHDPTWGKLATRKNPHIIRIVLTVAHLDHDPTNNSMDNLVALCQYHHNRYDIEHRAETRRATLAAKLKAKAIPEGYDSGYVQTKLDGMEVFIDDLTD